MSLGAFSVVSLASERVARADDTQQTAVARSLAKDGLEAFRQGDYEGALNLLARAEKVYHATTHVLYMARCHKELGRPVEAFELYNRILREKQDDDAPAAFIESKEAAGNEIGEVEALIAYVTVEVVGPGAESAILSVDEKEVPAELVGARAPVNPGTRTFRARTQDGGSATSVVEVMSGARQTVTLKLEADGATPTGTSEEALLESDSRAGPSPGASRVPAYVLFGIGAAGLAVGTIFSVSHFSKAGEAKDDFDAAGCKDSCTSDQKRKIDAIDDQAARAGTIGWIGFGVGAAGLVGGVTALVLSSQPPKDEALKKGVTPYLGWSEVGLHGRF